MPCMHASTQVAAPLCLQVCLEYLERYYVLIAFTAYLFEPAFDPEARSQVSLAQWMKRRPELYRYTTSFPFCTMGWGLPTASCSAWKSSSSGVCANVMGFDIAL